MFVLFRFQDCFKGNWSIHKALHKANRKLNISFVIYYNWTSVEGGQRSILNRKLIFCLFVSYFGHTQKKTIRG